MKANELMIGDWVCNYKNTPEQLIAIDAYNSSVTGTSRYEYCDMDRIKPIPLTEEILKANDEKLKANGVSYGDCHMEETKWFCYIKDTDVYCYELQWKFKYVHELQHALRLCGLNELADNLKIKAMEE